MEAAKGLAYSAPQLMEGVQRVEAARLELTAIVEPLRAVSDTEDEAMERYRFGTGLALKRWNGRIFAW